MMRGYLMARCKVCNRFGLFLKLNNGVCKQCEDAEATKQEAEIKRKKELQKKKDEEIKRRREEHLRNLQLEAKEELDSIPLFTIELSAEKRKRNTGYEVIPFSNITPKGKYAEFVVFDTETTGLTPSKDRVIELAAVRFVDGKPVERFETLINPEREIPAEASAVNKITNEMVADAPTMSQILPAFESFVGSSNLVAHNLEFDLKFMFYSGCSVMETKRKYFDTLEQASKLLKKPKKKYDKEFGDYEIDYEKDFDVYDYKLETLCEYYGIVIADKHRAVADALATGKLFCSLIEEKQNR